MAELAGRGPSGEELIDLCLTELAAFTGPDAEQEDDITLVCLERTMSARYAGGGPMTSVAQPASRRLAAFAVASEPGNERLALARVAEAVAASGLPPARLERLKTAVAEATMNAIEHGNRGRPEVPVDVEVIQEGDDIIVAITDLGGEHAAPGRPKSRTSR